MFKLIIFVSFFSASLFVYAQKNKPMPVKKSSVVASLPTEVDTTFGATIALRHSAQVEKPETSARTLYFTHQINPYIKTENYKIDLDMYYYNFYDNQSLSDWDNSQLTWAWLKPWSLTDYFTLTPQLISVFPLFKKSSGDFQYAIGGRLTASLKSTEIGSPAFIFKYGLQVLKFGQKNEAIKGLVNGKEDFILDVNGDKQYTTSARLRQRVHLGYMLTEKLMALIYFHFDSNLLFDNSFRNGFYHETFLEYAVNDNFVINTGLSNGGGLFVGQYQEIDNLKFYSKESAEYFAGIGFTF